MRGIEARGFLKEGSPKHTRAGRPPADLLRLIGLARAVIQEAVEFSRRARVSTRARAEEARKFNAPE